MHGVLAAETTILVQLKTIRRVFLVLGRVVVPLLAFVASEGDFNAHYGTSNSYCLPVGFVRARNFTIEKHNKITSLTTGKINIPQPVAQVNVFSLNLSFF